MAPHVQQESAASVVANPINTENMDHETKLWSELPVEAWKQSVLHKDSVFHDLYLDTRRRLVEACHSHSYDVIVEVGCGTGEVISHLEKAGVPRIGVDINEMFIQHCKKAYKEQPDLSFYLGDATQLDTWWKECGFDKKYKAPLLVCPNNTINIMPEGIREEVISKMRVVAGTEGRCVITFWNGKMFAHGVMGFYKKNSDLCGEFDLTSDHINWEEGTIETKTKYKSTWLTAEDIVRWMHSLLINVDLAPSQQKETLEVDHVAECGMGVYVWVKGVGSDGDASASARDYYDSKDAQTFYTTIWGKNNTHIGRYDLVEADPKLAKLPSADKIRQAQILQEEELMKHVCQHYDGVKVRCLDMGCGYGGLLRTMASRGLLWSGTGVDISGEMIDACRRLTEEETTPDVQNILNWMRESYMNTSVTDEGIDLCISMDAFLHVGPGQHEAVLQEAWRVLRPGGRLIFTDILSKENAPVEAKQLYERIGLSSFGTVPGYFESAKKFGFGDLKFEPHSENLSKHYGSVHNVLQDYWKDGKVAVSEQFKDHMSEGLCKWRDLADSCLEWGVISMRKLENVSDSDSNHS